MKWCLAVFAIVLSAALVHGADEACLLGLTSTARLPVGSAIILRCGGGTWTITGVMRRNHLYRVVGLPVLLGEKPLSCTVDLRVRIGSFDLRPKVQKESAGFSTRGGASESTEDESKATAKGASFSLDVAQAGIFDFVFVHRDGPFARRCVTKNRISVN